MNDAPEKSPSRANDAAASNAGSSSNAGLASHASKTGAIWWPVGLSILLGALAGVGGYTFRYAEGFSYFSTDPTACVNCHIMQPQYDSWQKASHHTAAVCVDCHLPESFIPKYIAKAENGWRHGQKFTTQNFEEPMFVQAAGLRILQDNCERCHAAMTSAMNQSDRPGMSPHPGYRHTQGRSETLPCIHCHATVGHGERTGLGGRLRATDFSNPGVSDGALSTIEGEP